MLVIIIIRNTIQPKQIIMANQILGGWGEPRPLTESDIFVFERAIKSLIGVTYTPYEVETQVVNGTNYRFCCGDVLAIRDP